MPTQKYIVFKQEDFYQMMGQLALPPAWGPEVGADLNCAVLADNIRKVAEENRIDDAIVIRRQDPFAAAGLRGYSGAVLTALETIDILGYPSVEVKQRLTELADFFMDEAAAAEIQSRGKFPD